MLIYAGFIIGFDGERVGAGERIQAFVENTSIPQPMLGILQALPNTALWDRLEQENRLVIDRGITAVGDQNSLMNFTPTRPIAEIAREYLEGIWAMYEPEQYLRRCFLQCLNISPPSQGRQAMKFPRTKAFFIVFQILWLQGFRRSEIRGQFWNQLWVIARQKPQLLNLYLGLCAAGEHFWEYRQLARQRIIQQLGFDPMMASAPEMDWKVSQASPSRDSDRLRTPL